MMYLLFALGLILLIKGGDWFVDSATDIARRFHLPELLIGATIVSIGTTLPEILVSSTSALLGHSQIAYGNAIGSIICNAALIAAVGIAAHPMPVDPKTVRTPVLFFFISAVLFSLVAYTTGYFSRLTGFIFLAIFVIYMIVTVIQMKNDPGSLNSGSKDNSNSTEQNSSLIKTAALLIIGAVLIAFGADLIVDNGTLIAEAFGVPESVIAFTFVALGTSLPELATAITSILKGHVSLSLGNVIGANVFNLVLVCGTAISLSPFHIPENMTLFGYNATLVVEIPVMFLAMIILTGLPLIKGKVTRAQGIVLIAIYVMFCAYQFVIA